MEEEKKNHPIKQIHVFRLNVFSSRSKTVIDSFSILPFFFLVRLLPCAGAFRSAKKNSKRLFFNSFSNGNLSFITRAKKKINKRKQKKKCEYRVSNEASVCSYTLHLPLSLSLYLSHPSAPLFKKSNLVLNYYLCVSRRDCATTKSSPHDPKKKAKVRRL